MNLGEKDFGGQVKVTKNYCDHNWDSDKIFHVERKSYISRHCDYQETRIGLDAKMPHQSTVEGNFSVPMEYPTGGSEYQLSIPRNDDSNGTNHEFSLGNENDMTSPLLHQESQISVRQRGIRNVDIETGSVASTGNSRILDRNGTFGQSRGNWCVHRQSRHPASRSRCCRFFCRGRVWNEWNLGGWFHWLAYQRTIVLMMILFSVYTSIVIAFAAIYLGISIMGETIEKNPDGSEKHIPFCHMEINNRMEALYLSLSTMASIGYGGESYCTFFVCCILICDPAQCDWRLCLFPSVQLLFW